MTIELPRSVRVALEIVAAAAAPDEACALLRLHRLPGDAVYVARAVPLRNVHPTPTHGFELDPAELRAVLAAELRDGASVASLGFFHSHPEGVGPELSGSDRRALDQATAVGHGWLWLVLAGGELRAYDPDGEPVELVDVEP